MKIHLAAAAFVLIAAWYFNCTVGEVTVLVLTIGIVMIAEMINTAIEAMVDLVSPDRHPLAKKAKDVAAGAVLVSAGVAVVIACLILWSRVTG